MQENNDFSSNNTSDKAQIALSSNQHIYYNKESKFSYYKRPIKNTKPYRDITLSDVAKSIKCERAKKATEKLRACEDADKARAFKATQLDYATFSGTFSKRGDKHLIEYSSLMVLDLDDVDVEDVKHKLLNQTDFDIALMFISPSGNGVKVVVPSTTRDEHEQVFSMYQRYFKEVLNLEVDESGKDISRACFIAYDAEVYLNENYAWHKLEEYWDDTLPEQSTQKDSTNTPYTTTQTSAVQYDEELSPFDDYSNRGDVLSLLKSHKWRVDEKASDNVNIRLIRPGKNGGTSADLRRSDKLLYVYTSNSVFEPQKAYNPTMVFTLLNYGSLDNDAYNKAGKKLQEMGYGDQKAIPSPYTTQTSSVKEDSKALNFYTDDFNITASGVAKFFEYKGFIRISEQGNDTITIIKNDNKILNPFNYRTDTLSFLKKHIAHPEKRAKIENLLVARKNVIQNCWELMKGEPYNLHRDTKDAIYLPFKNGVCKVTKDNLEMIDYKSEELSFFIGTESQKHHFELFDIDKRGMGDFERFIIYAIIGRETEELTEKELRDVQAFNSMVGYLISNYKNSAESPAVILSDEGADDEARKGARGKSLLTQAIRKVRGSKFRDGATFDSGYRHVFADLEKYDDIYILDDVLRNFNFNALYTNITGDITAERKGTHAVTIPFADAPKFVVTTNWAVRYDGDADSTNRRFVEYKFSHFWNIKHTPESYFGKRFFDDWDGAEWQQFHEYMIACGMQYLTTGLMRIFYSKDEDNYRAYFTNDVALEEFERIFEIMRSRGNFSVTDFLKEHENNSLFRYKRIFNHINTRDRVNVYIKKHNVNVIYSKKDKRWYFQQEIDTPLNNNDKKPKLPFK